MTLDYKGEDTNFSLSIRDYNHAREVLSERLQRGVVRTSKILVLASERHLTSIINKIQSGTEHQRSWVLENRAQINEEIRQLNLLRQQLEMENSPLSPIPQAPLEPEQYYQPGEGEVNPQPDMKWTALGSTLFFGGAAMKINGLGHVLNGAGHALTGGYAFFKAAEVVGKKAASEIISEGLKEIGGGAFVYEVGDQLMQAGAPRPGCGGEESI